MKKIVGLTGPIGAGKDTVAKVLQKHGASVIDADRVAHSLYESPRSPVWQSIVRVFGSKILNRGGKINRKKLGEIVFSDKRLRKKLNSIVHPRLKEAVIEEIGSRKQQLGIRKQSTELRAQVIIVNAAVLKEIGLIEHVDEVWVVMAPRAKRLQRLLKMGLTKQQANLRLQSQMSQKDYLKLADVVIRNDRSLKVLSKQVLSLF